MITKSVLYGMAATTLLLLVYFVIITSISGWWFALDQFSQFWYFVVSLAVGFGIQVGLYSYLRGAAHRNVSGGTVVVSGATSTVAMISCCAHYLVNILPIIGITGAITIVGQYQIELFWTGLAFNVAGIVYILRKLIQFTKEQ